MLAVEKGRSAAFFLVTNYLINREISFFDVTPTCQAISPSAHVQNLTSED